MHWGDTGGWGWGNWLVAAMLLLVFAAAITALLVMLFRRPSDQQAPYGPERILAERFARGEIDEEEYRQRSRVLRESQ